MKERAKFIERLGWSVFALCALGIAMMMFSSAHAATFYVDPAGNDSHDGLSQGTAWQTVAKVNGSTFQAGDQILFKRGGEWHEALAASSSGAPNNPIVYDAYGTGANPKFWGSDVLNNANWQPQGNNVYSYPGLSAGNVTEVLANHGTETNGQWFNSSSGNPVQNFPGTFSYSFGTLLINSASNPASDGRVYTIVTRQDVVYSNGKNHLVFRNLQGDETADPSAGYVFRVMGSQDVLIDSCQAYRGGRHNFGVINSDAVIGQNLATSYAMPQVSGGATFYVTFAGSDSPFAAGTCKWINCSADHFEDGNGGAYQYFVCHGSNQGPITFINPLDYGGKFSILQDVPAQTVTIKGGLIQDADLEIFASNMLVDGVKITGNSSVDVYGSSNVFQNCLITVNPNPATGGQTGYNTALLTRNSNSTNNVFRFNTVVIDPASSATCLVVAASGQHTQWYGNIFMSNGTAMDFWFFTPTAADASQTNYNFYNANATFDFGSTTFAQWKALGFADQNSLSGNPLFNNPAAGDYTLQSGSPAINAANLSSTLLTQMPTDFAGNTRLQGNAFDMGAFEFSSTPSVPLISSSNTASGTVGKAFTYQIQASNTPTSYGALNLPANLSVSASGLISGIPAAAGQTTVTLQATNAAGTGTLNLTLTIAPAANVPPTVSITAPVDGTLFPTAPASISITANAADSDGTIAKVDFYSGTTLIGTISTSPYTFTWNAIPAGVYSLTAKATDNGGLSTTSAAIRITVGNPDVSPNGTTYYVSPTGNDANDGKSTSTPWKTVAKVNASSFNAGDWILFQRGGEWREQLVPNVDGAAGNPILFGAYGAGAKPKLWGSVVLSNANFVHVSGNTYSYTTNFPVDHHEGVAVDHQLLPWTGFFSGTTLNTVENSAYSTFTIDDSAGSSSVIYVNTGGSNPVSNGKVYSVCVREDEVLANHHNHLVFRDLVVDETAKEESGYGFRITGCNDVQLLRCEAYRVGVAHFGVVDTDQFSASQCLAVYAMPNQNFIRNAAFLVVNNTNGSTQFADCTAQHLENFAGQKNYWVFAYVGNGTGAGVMKNVTCTGFGGGTFYIAGNNHVTVQGGVIENGYGESFNSGFVLDGLTITGTGGIDQYGNNATIQNCVFTSSAGRTTGGYPTEILFRNGAQGNTVRFCTLALTDGAAVMNQSSATQTSIYGNILLSTNPVYSGPSGNVATCDYNFYKPAPIFSDSNLSLTAWRGLGFDQRSLTGDPKFKNAAGGDYSLQATSSAIDAVALSGSNVPPTDALGIVRPLGNAPDMGAYEFNGNSPLTIATTILANGVVGTAYLQNLSALGGSGTYTWSILSGSLPDGLTMTSAGKISGTPTIDGVFNVTIEVTDSVNVTASAAFSITITKPAPVNQPPAITSGPTATPNPASVNVSVSFAGSASDPDNDTLTYAWNFGDGASASGSTATHSYSAAGTYTVKLTVTDTGGRSVSATISMVVTSSGTNGNDGNGSGSDGNGGGATPPTILSMNVSKLLGSTKFNATNHDSCSIAGIIPNLPSSFTPAGQQLVLNIGGASVAFTLDRKGRGKSAQGSIILKLKGKRTKGVLAFVGGDVPFTGKIQKGTWAAAWGFNPNSSGANNATMTIDVQLGGNTYAATVTLKTSSKANVGTKFKK